MSASLMISGAMEAAEKGLLPSELQAGLDLRFGSTVGMLGLLEQITLRQGLGDLLAEGPNGICDKLGEAAAACFLHVKGQPLPLHEPRWKAGMGIGFAISPTGADHMHNMHDAVYTNEGSPAFGAARNMGILDAVDSTALGPQKARLFVYMMLNKSVVNNLALCSFMPYSLDMMVDQVKSVTGWNVSSWEILKATERSLAMARGSTPSPASAGVIRCPTASSSRCRAAPSKARLLTARSSSKHATLPTTCSVGIVATPVRNAGSCTSSDWIGLPVTSKKPDTWLTRIYKPTLQKENMYGIQTTG